MFIVDVERNVCVIDLWFSQNFTVIPIHKNYRNRIACPCVVTNRARDCVKELDNIWVNMLHVTRTVVKHANLENITSHTYENIYLLLLRSFILEHS